MSMRRRVLLFDLCLLTFALDSSPALRLRPQLFTVLLLRLLPGLLLESRQRRVDAGRRKGREFQGTNKPSVKVTPNDCHTQGRGGEFLDCCFFESFWHVPLALRMTCTVLRGTISSEKMFKTSSFHFRLRLARSNMAERSR